jgi:hypothetical protein
LYPKLTGAEVLDWFASLRRGVNRRVRAAWSIGRRDLR